MAKKADFAIVNANELATLKGVNDKPRVKEEMSDLGVIKDGAVAARDGRIVAVGTTKRVLGELEEGFETIDDIIQLCRFVANISLHL